jgi:hypothetical protein
MFLKLGLETAHGTRQLLCQLHGQHLSACLHQVCVGQLLPVSTEDLQVLWRAIHHHALSCAMTRSNYLFQALQYPVPDILVVGAILFRSRMPGRQYFVGHCSGAPDTDASHNSIFKRLTRTCVCSRVNHMKLMAA